jgi:hypothetical protein
MAKSRLASKGKKKKKKLSSVVLTSFEPTSLPVEEFALGPAEEPAPEPAPEPADESAPARAEEWPAEEQPFEEPPVEEQPVEEQPVEEQPVEEQPAEEPIEIGVVCEQQDESCFRIQVSAKHLMLASSVFKKILTGGWKESVAYLQKGSVEITTEGWDIEALLILLRAIHSQHYHIPRKLTLEMLAKVAVLVDYYECKEATSVWTTIWIDSLEEKIPSTYSRDLFLWLWISWFLQLPTQFKKLTSTVMSQSNGWINNGLGLPIPDKVMGKPRRTLNVLSL